MLALLGPNGGGKTTLLKTLLGMLKPLAGEASIDDRSLHAYSIRERARRIAYVPQVHAPTFAFTVESVVLMGRTAHGNLFSRPSAKDREVATRSLDQFGIGHLKERPYTMISGGERQLVLLARALAQEPQFIVLDEPTASLDFGNQGKVMREIRALAASGHGVLFTTHDPNHALRAADRAYLLRGGERIAEGKVGEVLTREQLGRSLWRAGRDAHRFDKAARARSCRVDDGLSLRARIRRQSATGRRAGTGGFVMCRRMALSFLAAIPLAIIAAQAGAAELRVLGAGPVEGTFKGLIPAFTNATGHKVEGTFDTVGVIQDKLKKGEKADIIILSTAVMEDMEKAGSLVAGTRVEIGRGTSGFAVRAGAPVPDISTPDAMKATLLAARSVAYVDPALGATTGIHFAKVLERLAIADAVNKKAVLLSPRL